jgi:hypothetical protein
MDDSITLKDKASWAYLLVGSKGKIVRESATRRRWWLGGSVETRRTLPTYVAEIRWYEAEREKLNPIG